MKISMSESEAKFTRPNDTTAYTIDDAVSDSTSSPNAIDFLRTSGTKGKFLRVTRVTLSKTGLANPDLQLWLFNKDITPINDNAAFSISDDDARFLKAVINLYTPYQAVNNCFYDTGEIAKDILLDSNESTLYGLLRTVEAFTPAAQEIFRFKLYSHILD